MADIKPSDKELKLHSHTSIQEKDPRDTIKNVPSRHTLADMAPAARNMMAKFGVLTKDVPIKIANITPLLRDGSNYRHWNLDFQCYVGFIPDVADYVNGVKQETEEDYKQDFADVVNCLIHWTIDRELSCALQDISSPFGRLEELRKQFSGVSFAARRAVMKELYTIMYDPKSGSLEQHVTTMRGKRDHLTRIGVRVPDDIFAIILSNSVPQGFPDIANHFESRLISDEEHVVSASDVIKAMGAADVNYRSANTGAEVMKVWAKPRGAGPSGEGRTCFWCDIRGHTIRECRKKKEHDRAKAAGSSAKTDLKSARIVEVEAAMAGVDLAPWDDPKEVTVSPMSIQSDSSEAVFDTGATHTVFND